MPVPSARFFGDVDPADIREAALMAEIAYNSGASLATRLAGLGQTALDGIDLGLAPGFSMLKDTSSTTTLRPTLPLRATR